MTRPSPAVIDVVDALHRQRVADGIAPSSVWGVFDRDGLVASGGAGDRGDGTAPDADTVYRIASCTKSVTATTLLGLVGGGAALPRRPGHRLRAGVPLRRPAHGGLPPSPRSGCS
ncbi:serine hydrolase domain-containing protein [Curtobacterium sp. MCPF17_052]|uniref:serine hydrolase n=1 Tax=Curtobacterium sp. MCPF17_052 TaxID=2175655 RepID=UPI0024DFC6F0|nr:serine hydrolase domain-containing protein [Curtobacterium sp. MCPF17_052]WIB13127.1 serine hydrolase domain-containing protein [Curtobacterium sp. MCPF17_052]